ncbi:MAG TPA: FtsX-like permease family protein [Burkholderiales bacterium]
MLRLLRVLSARRPRGRAVLPVLGIALGVALGYGVHLVNRAAVGDVAAAVRALAGAADLEVRGGRSGFADSLYPRIAKVPGVAIASPGLDLEAGIAGGERTIRIVGIDTLRDAALHGVLHSELLKPDTVLLSSRAAQLVAEQTLRLIVGQKTVSLRVAGTVEMPGVAALADLSTAQWRLQRLGELNKVEIRLARGADSAAVQDRIAALLPPGTYVSRLSEIEESSGYPSRAYRVNMNVLALVALFTGGFLVFSAQALEVTRRRAEHALLRVLGMRRREIARLVFTEAGILGAAGSLLGLVLGYGLAYTALRTFGGDLGAGAFRGVFPQIGFSVLPALLYFLSGVLVALAGAFLPALDAARTPAAQALKAGDEQAIFQRVRAWPGLVLVAAGAALAQLGPVRGIPVFGYASIACLLVGSIALMPVVSGLVFRAGLSPRSPVLALALSQLRGAPGQAAVSLAAIVASFSLMAAMAVMVASFRESVDRWLDSVLPAQLYFRTTYAGETGYVEPEFQRRILALPMIARVDFLRSARITLDPARPPVAVIARDRAALAFPLASARYDRKPDDPPAVWVSEAIADFYGFHPGERIVLPLAGKREAFVVGGVFRDYARQHGAVLIDRSDYVALTGDRRVNDGALWLAPGVSAADAMQAILGLPGAAQLEIAAPGEIREASLRIFDRSFAVTYAMEAVAVLVGLFGLSSSLGAIVLARRREFGMLRHLGLTRPQIRGMLAAEGGLLALLGALAGLVTGAAISLVLIFVVNRQSFNWSMELHPPYAFLGALMALLVALAILTAVLSGKEAMGMGPVRAVREDW